jgi:hypothetical protein
LPRVLRQEPVDQRWTHTWNKSVAASPITAHHRTVVDDASINSFAARTLAGQPQAGAVELVPAIPRRGPPTPSGRRRQTRSRRRSRGGNMCARAVASSPPGGEGVSALRQHSQQPIHRCVQPSVLGLRPSVGNLRACWPRVAIASTTRAAGLPACAAAVRVVRRHPWVEPAVDVEHRGACQWRPSPRPATGHAVREALENSTAHRHQRSWPGPSAALINAMGANDRRYD